MELLKDINNYIESNLNINLDQNIFLGKTLGEVANSALDIGLKTILPDFIENDIIEIKNTMLNEGLEEGIKKAIDISINFGRETIGLLTGNFKSLEEAKQAISDGGILENISNSIDFILDKTNSNGMISNNLRDIISSGKDIILNCIKYNIDNNFNKQEDSLSKIESYTANWYECYNNKNFENMTEEYSKLTNEINNILPMENEIKTYNIIENLQTIIANNKGNFDISNEELSLAKMLV